MKDGQTLLAELGKLGRPDSPVYFRAHNLLNTGDTAPALKWGSTNVYTEDADGNPVYDWTTVDRIFDAYLAGGVRPFVELGFMPEALSTHPEPYQHQWRPGRPYDEIITGWAYPPKSYDKWRELCYQLAKHCVDRYGEAEVATWYFECWNEAEGAYWKGTRAGVAQAARLRRRRRAQGAADGPRRRAARGQRRQRVLPRVPPTRDGRHQ